MLGVFDKMKKEKPATPETPEDSTPRPESLQNWQKPTEATSRQSTPQTHWQYERKLNVNGVELLKLLVENAF